MIDGYEPLLMFTIPRLAIIRWVQPLEKGVCSLPCTSPFFPWELGSQTTPNMIWALSPHSGLLIYPEGPLSLERRPEEMSRVFSPFYNLLKKIRCARGGDGWGCGGTVGP